MKTVLFYRNVTADQVDALLAQGWEPVAAERKCGGSLQTVLLRKEGTSVEDKPHLRLLKEHRDSWEPERRSPTWLLVVLVVILGVVLFFQAMSR